MPLLKRVSVIVLWIAVAVGAAVCLGAIATSRGEHINSMWLVLAAACSYLIGYRFYGKFIAARVMALNDERATPAERLENGHDYVADEQVDRVRPSFRRDCRTGTAGRARCWRRSSAICPERCGSSSARCSAGQCRISSFFSLPMRRDGKSLGQMAREEVGKVGGIVALITVLLIMIILLAVVALVVVNALAGSPWGVFTIAATMPIAVFMGLYLRFWRPGKVLECSAIGFVLVCSIRVRRAMGCGRRRSAPMFTLSGDRVAICDHYLWLSRQRAAGVAVACARAIT